MALVKCPECNADVSEQALKCPSCGFQLNKPQRTLTGKIIKWSFIVFNVVMLLFLIGALSIEESEVTSVFATGAVLWMWFIGDFILGILVLLTRPKG